MNIEKIDIATQRTQSKYNSEEAKAAEKLATIRSQRANDQAALRRCAELIQYREKQQVIHDGFVKWFEEHVMAENAIDKLVEQAVVGGMYSGDFFAQFERAANILVAREKKDFILREAKRLSTDGPDAELAALVKSNRELFEKNGLIPQVVEVSK